MAHCLSAERHCVMWPFGGVKHCLCTCDVCTPPQPPTLCPVRWWRDDASRYLPRTSRPAPDDGPQFSPTILDADTSRLLQSHDSLRHLVEIEPAHFERLEPETSRAALIAPIHFPPPASDGSDGDARIDMDSPLATRDMRYATLTATSLAAVERHANGHCIFSQLLVVFNPGSLRYMDSI